MQVICTDGTTFACQSYGLTEYGVKLYDQEEEPGEERYDDDPEPVAYVPHERLWYIVPDGVRPNIPGMSTAPGQPQTQGAGVPAGGSNGPGRPDGQAGPTQRR